MRKNRKEVVDKNRQQAVPMGFYSTQKYSEEIPVPALLYEGRSVT